MFRERCCKRGGTASDAAKIRLRNVTRFVVEPDLATGTKFLRGENYD